MNFNSHIDQLFAFLIYFSMFTIRVKSDLYGTLNFDRENLSLIDIHKKIENLDPTVGHELAIACPAHSSPETDFNSGYSLSKNSLFVRGVYGKMVPPSSVSNDICDDLYKLSIAYHKLSGELVFGYEVYYNSKVYSQFKDSNYADFDSLGNKYSKKRSIASKSKLSFSEPKLELKQKIDQPVPLGFVWILIFRLKFDNSTKSPTQVIYTLSKGTEMGTECKDYSLGNEVYKKDENDYVDSLYRNQVRIFNNVEIPILDSGCEIKNNCLIKYSLIPAEEFRFRSPEPKSISCSNLTTVPIWRSTIQGILQKLDKFLYALVKFANKTLTVLSGVHGQLKMKKNRLRGSLNITLGDKNEMPVSNIIYKVVKYEYKVEEKLGDNFPKITKVREAVIIVVHNHPQFDRKDALCPGDNNCEKWGWSEILNEAISSSSEYSSNIANIYCCPAHEEIVKKLGKPYDKNFISNEILYLTEFPVYDEESSKWGTKNIQKEVRDEMRKLFGGKSISEGVAEDESEMKN